MLIYHLMKLIMLTTVHDVKFVNNVTNSFLLINYILLRTLLNKFDILYNY